MDIANFINHYLEGNFAPVKEEKTAVDLPTAGKIPDELNGLFLRNGPNAIGKPEPSTYHNFAGEGMVHGVCLRNGKALWYRNRWVRGDTVRAVLDESDIGGPVHAHDFAANTNIIGFAGKLWALVEGGTYPIELDRELNSVCRNNFFGTLPGAFSPHPQLDPKTGELHALCYSWDTWDYVQYVVVGNNGRVRRTENISLPGMTMLHAMGLTQRYAIVFDFPVLLNLQMAQSGHPNPFRWNNDYGARIGLMPREGFATDIQWFEVSPCYVYHPVNAYDAEDGSVIMDVCRYERMFDRDLHGPFGDSLSTLDRWRFDPSNGKMTETRLDERYQEFPRINPHNLSLPYQYAYLATFGEGSSYAGTIKQDLVTGTALIHNYGEGYSAGEPVFIPRQDAKSEDDGWILTFVYDGNTNTSDLVILDALDFTAAPVAEVRLPQRVPFGFHGDWVPESTLQA
ncbi:MAG: carotenoid oxygenase family protein [Pleurocapsa minor HA4230-MV1]|jgi:carotenoid cleavage dioxygenase|nr:carotenoid oxygenase family protein [Pleurocapsa minor HA4230-MV1]